MPRFLYSSTATSGNVMLFVTDLLGYQITDNLLGSYEHTLHDIHSCSYIPPCIPAAPAAFEESVRVCLDCKAMLDNYAENARISYSIASAPT